MQKQTKGKKLNIIYFGTPEFASVILEHLITSGYSIRAVVTMPDKPAGRGHKLQPSAVKEVALRHDLPVLQPVLLKDPEFLSSLSGYDADLFVVIAFRMLPREVWDMPRLGTFNLHASLLPAYRGAAPIQRALLNGESETGVTTFFLNERIDEGHIILRQKVSITPDDNGGTLHDKLMTAGCELVPRTLELIAEHNEWESVPTLPQPDPTHGEWPQAPKIFKEDRMLSFVDDPAEQVVLRVRAMAPYPLAISTWVLKDGKSVEVKIYEAVVAPQDLIPEGLKLGHLTLTPDKELLVATADKSAVIIRKLQWPSKKPVEAKSFVNGFDIDSVVQVY